MGSLMLSFTHIIPIIGGITLLINGINAQTKTRRGAFRFATTKINRFSDSARCSYGLILPLKLNLLFVEPTPVVSGDKKKPNRSREKWEATKEVGDINYQRWAAIRKFHVLNWLMASTEGVLTFARNSHKRENHYIKTSLYLSLYLMI